MAPTSEPVKTMTARGAFWGVLESSATPRNRNHPAGAIQENQNGKRVFLAVLINSFPLEVTERVANRIDDLQIVEDVRVLEHAPHQQNIIGPIIHHQNRTCTTHAPSECTPC